MTEYSSSSSHVAYLSHCDLAVDLNNVACSLIDESSSSSSSAKKNVLEIATSVLRDSLDALSRPPVPVRDERDGPALGAYLAYREEIADRTRRRLREAYNQDETTTTSTAPSPPRRQQSGEARRQRQQQGNDYSPLVYSEPLRLEPLEDNSAHRPDGAVDSTSGDDVPSLKELSAAVLFNLSLAHHLAGERGGSASLVSRASEFYRMTQAMVLRAARQRDGEGEIAAPFLVIIVKAVVNNTGQSCLQWLGETELGKEYFSRLASLEAADRRGETGAAGTGVGLPPSPMDAFAFNAMVVNGGMNAAGAA